MQATAIPARPTGHPVDSVAMTTVPTASRGCSPWLWAGIALACAVLAFVCWVGAAALRGSPLHSALQGAFWVLAALQILFGLVAVVAGIGHRVRVRRGGIGAAAVGLCAMAGGAVGGFVGTVLGAYAGGGGWGRPLRVRGRQLHPELRLGSDWTDGLRPDPTALDAATARALEALWLPDAQKEHASVPAFARVSWLLAAAGAPAELLAWSHRAGLEEIEHAQRCFALAAGYGGRTHTVEPMPELLVGGLDADGDVFALLVREGLADGCLLEGFNADVAGEGAAVCEDPATRAVLVQIAREERSHADLSWAIVRWALAHGGERAADAARRAIDGLGSCRRPTAVSRHKQALVQAADPAALLRHGRLPDARWAELWHERLRATEQRARAGFVQCTGAAAAAAAAAVP